MRSELMDSSRLVHSGSHVHSAYLNANKEAYITVFPEYRSHSKGRKHCMPRNSMHIYPKFGAMSDYRLHRTQVKVREERCLSKSTAKGTA